MAAYERRPSCCSCSMIAFETSSSGCDVRPGFLLMGGWFRRRAAAVKGFTVARGDKRFRCEDVSYRRDRLSGAPPRGTIRCVEGSSKGVRMVQGPTGVDVAGCLVAGCSRPAAALRSPGVSVAALKLPFFDIAAAQSGPGDVPGRRDVSATDKRADRLQLAGVHRPVATKASHDPDDRSRTAPASRSPTPTTSTTTPSSTPRCSNQLGACEPIKRDIMVLTDWMAARMIGLGWIQPLDPRPRSRTSTRT